MSHLACVQTLPTYHLSPLLFLTPSSHGSGSSSSPFSFIKLSSPLANLTFLVRKFHNTYTHTGADPGEVKWVNFHPPFSEPPPFFFFSCPSNIDWFFYIITKIHPPFQNSGSTPDIHDNTCPKYFRENTIFSLI